MSSVAIADFGLFGEFIMLLGGHAIDFGRAGAQNCL
jgi:hypothetical protein